MSNVRNRFPPPLPEGHELYIPDVYYFQESAEAWLPLTLLVCARCVVQWADHYVAVCPDQIPLSGPRHKGSRLEGEFPSEYVQKQASLEEIFSWAQDRACSLPELYLLRGTHYLLYFDGDLHFNLVLTPEQFRTVEDWWVAHALPRDLYFPASQRRPTQEEATRGDAGSAVIQGYTPRQWEKRDEIRRFMNRLGHGAVLEEFDSVSQEFVRAAALLRDQLSKSSKESDWQLAVELETLEKLVSDVSLKLPGVTSKP